MRDELGRLGRGEIKPEHADIDRDSLDTVCPSYQDACLLVDGFHDADGGVDAIQDLRGRCMNRDPHMYLPACECCGTEHEGRIVTAWQL